MVNCKTYERNIIFKVMSSTWINISMRKKIAVEIYITLRRVLCSHII